MPDGGYHIDLHENPPTDMPGVSLEDLYRALEQITDEQVEAARLSLLDAGARPMPERIEYRNGDQSPKTGRTYGRLPVLVTRDRLLDAWQKWGAQFTRHEADCLAVTVTALEKIAADALKPREPAACGTVAGRERHRKAGEPVCADCKRAMADYMKQWRKSRKANSDAS